MPRTPKLTDFRAVLFDVDGTLVNSIDVIVLGITDTFHRFQQPCPTREVILGQIGVPLTRQLANYEGVTNDPVVLSDMAKHAMEMFEIHAHAETPFQDAIEALRVARAAGLKIALVTSKSKNELTPFLKRFDATRHVDATVSASDVQKPKPDPESAWLACRLLEVKPSEAIFIGDSIFDIQCAKSAGMKSAAVGYGAGRTEDLMALDPELYFPTPESLLSWALTAENTTSCPGRK